MKKYLTILAAAAFLAAACSKPEPTPTPTPEPEPEPTPTPVEKVFTVSPSSISAKAEDTSATITVTSEVAWTAKSDNAAFTVNPASGNGNASLTVSFPANTVESEVKANITVATTDENAKTKNYTVDITQAAAEKVPEPGPEPGQGKDTTYLARWWFDESQAAILGVHFTEEAKLADKSTNPEACKPGNGGYYVEPNVSGKGRIEFYNGIDKTDINPKGRVKRVIGKYGGVVSYGTWKGDYYLMTANTDQALPAGTDIYTFFALRANVDNVPRYWMVEIRDGDTWKPYLETKKVVVEGEGEVEYNLEIIYDNEAELLKCPNSIVDSEYKLTSATKDIQIRILAVSSAYAFGPGLPSVIGDSSISAKNPVTILVGNRANNSEPVLHHTMICTVK